MKQIGRRIFYDILTGNVILDKGELQGSVITTTVEQDITTFVSLSERNRNTFDVLELPYGARAQDFAECNGYRVNVETKELEFSYPDPNNPEAPQEFGPPLTQQISDIRADMESAIMELSMAISIGGMTQ